MNYYFKFFMTMTIFFIGGVVTTHAQEKSIDVDTKHEIDIKDSKENQLMYEYAWLSKHIDVKDCSGEHVTVLKMKKGDTKFILIEKDNKKVMYDVTGKLYCTDHKELDCMEFYKLDATEETWTCNASK